MLPKSDPRYVKMHRLVRKLRGPAREQDCARCGKSAYAWAQVHTEDGLDPWADYVPLCMSCHMIYDQVGVGKAKTAEHRANISAAKKGWRPSPEHLAKLHASVRGVPKTAEHKAKIAAGRTGKRHTEAARAKMSKINRITQAGRRRDSLGRYMGNGDDDG